MRSSQKADSVTRVGRVNMQHHMLIQLLLGFSLMQFSLAASPSDVSPEDRSGTLRSKPIITRMHPPTSPRQGLPTYDEIVSERDTDTSSPNYADVLKGEDPILRTSPSRENLSKARKATGEQKISIYIQISLVLILVSVAVAIAVYFGHRMAP